LKGFPVDPSAVFRSPPPSARRLMRLSFVGLTTPFFSLPCAYHWLNESSLFCSKGDLECRKSHSPPPHSYSSLVRLGDAGGQRHFYCFLYLHVKCAASSTRVASTMLPPSSLAFLLFSKSLCSLLFSPQSTPDTPTPLDPGPSQHLIEQWHQSWKRERSTFGSWNSWIQFAYAHFIFLLFIFLSLACAPRSHYFGVAHIAVYIEKVYRRKKE